MSVIDHAAVRIEASRTAVRRQRLPPHWRVAVAFALLQVPLTLIAIIFEWRPTWGTPNEVGPILLDLLAYGSAVSGPLAPQIVLLISPYWPAVAASRASSAAPASASSACSWLGAHDAAVRAAQQPQLALDDAACRSAIQVAPVSVDICSGPGAGAPTLQLTTKPRGDPV